MPEWHLSNLTHLSQAYSWKIDQERYYYWAANEQTHGKRGHLVKQICMYIMAKNAPAALNAQLCYIKQTFVQTLLGERGGSSCAYVCDKRWYDTMYVKGALGANMITYPEACALSKHTGIHI